MSAIKISRARKLSLIGDNPNSFAAMRDAIPADIVKTLSSRQIATLIDANWRLAQRSKALALNDATRNSGHRE